MADIRLSNGRSLTVQAVLPDVFRVRFQMLKATGNPCSPDMGF